MDWSRRRGFGWTWRGALAVIGVVKSEPADTFIQANVNGELCDAREGRISPLDRGFLYGDAAYEVCRSYDGRLFAWREHWERLEKTAEGIALELPFSEAEAQAEIERTIAAWREATGSEAEVYARLQTSRGAGAIGLDTELAERPATVIYVKALFDLTDEQLDRGYSLHVPTKLIRNSIDALSPALKTGNYLNNILGLREAKRAGADDALFLNGQGRFCEASTRNVWFVFADRIVTPPLTDGLLAGVTRRLLLERIGTFEGRPLVEASVEPGQLRNCQEVFLTSSTQDIQPVGRVDERRYATGPNTVSRRLKRAFRDTAVRQCASPR